MTLERPPPGAPPPAPAPAGPDAPGPAAAPRLRLRAVAVRVVVLAALGAALAAGLPERVLAGAPNAHGAAKVGLGLAQTLLWRAPLLPGVVLGAVVALAVVPALPRRARLVGLAVAVAALVAIPGARPLALALGAALLAGNALLDGRRVPALALVPGAEVLLPVPVLDALGVPRVGLGNAALRAAFAVPLALAWFAADAALGMPAHVDAVLAWDRPRDPDLRAVAHAPAGIACEFHDVDVLPDRYHVLQEGSFRLVARARADDRVLAEEPLPPWWGPGRGLTLDSETDGARTWYWRVPDTLVELRRTDGGWRRGAEAHVGKPITHAYTTRVEALGRLFVHTIGVNPEAEGRVVSARLDDLGDVRDLPLRTADGAPLPPPRDVEWIPPLRRFALAPDMGDRLWLEDPETGVVTPWTSMPTMNGRLRWVPELERLFVAVPSRGAVWVLAADGTIERTLPAPFGVRPVEVDVARGLYVVASVLRETVEVRRLEDGALVRRIGSVMPMVREIRLDPATGEGWLSTWSVLYRFRYAP